MLRLLVILDLTRLKLTRESCVFWPKMRQTFDYYWKSSGACQKNKSFRRNTSAPLQLLPVSESPSEVNCLDFVSGLRTRSGYDPILVIIDDLTKMGHFITTNSNSCSVDLAHLFIYNVFRLRGLIKTIASDRDPKFYFKILDCFVSILELQVEIQ